MKMTGGVGVVWRVACVVLGAMRLLDNVELGFEYQVIHLFLVSPDFSFCLLHYAENALYSSRVVN